MMIMMMLLFFWFAWWSLQIYSRSALVKIRVVIDLETWIPLWTILDRLETEYLIKKTPQPVTDGKIAVKKEP